MKNHKFGKELFVHQDDTDEEGIDLGFYTIENIVENYDIDGTEIPSAIVAIYKLDKIVKVEKQTKIIMTPLK